MTHNQTAPNIAVYLRNGSNTSFVEHEQQPFVGDYRLDNTTSVLTAEEALSLVREKQISGGFWEFVYRKPLLPCVSENLFVFLLTKPTAYCEEHSITPCTIIVGAESRRVCHTMATNATAFPGVPLCSPSGSRRPVCL